MLGPSLINEVLVGYSQTTVVSETFDWAGVGAGNAALRDRRRPAHRRPEPDQLGPRRSPCPGAIATDSDTLAKTYQINEKLTWLKGRHALKFGGQFLRYDQQRFYAGNNGLLGYIAYNGSFTGLRSSPTSCSTRCRARAGGAAIPTIPGPTSRTGSRSSSRTTSR